ncbi:MAG: Holliday junction branch migration protein RuvA [Phycisphaerales bacterium]
MITQIEGTLTGLHDGAAHLRVGDLTYEVLVPAADTMVLAASLGQRMTFHTLHYLEGQGQGSSFWPRLIGFRSVRDREFFELFTTVKGIGNRRALRALQLPFARVAEAIALRDLATLQSLPEVGRRTAEAICVELKGKVDAYVVRSAVEAGGATGGASGVNGPAGKDGSAGAVGATGTAGTPSKRTTKRAATTEPKTEAARADADAGSATDLIVMANSAVEVLVQLGHTRLAAREMVERVIMARDTPPASAGDLVTEALR